MSNEMDLILAAKNGDIENVRILIVISFIKTIL